MAEYTPPRTKVVEAGPEEKQMLKFLDTLESESIAVEKDTKSAWDSNLAWFRGQQWTTKNRRPLFLANKINEIVRRKAAKLTEMKPEIYVQARRKGLKTTATVLEETIQAGWDEYGMQMLLSDVVYNIELYGAGVLSLQYDNSLDFGRGDIVPRSMDPRYFHVDPILRQAQSIDQAAYVWSSSYVSTWDIRRRWPARGAYVGLTSPDGRAENSVKAYTRKLFGMHGSGNRAVPEAIPRSEIKEYWFQDPTLDESGMPLYPGGRRVIRGGSDVILEDGPNPYYDQRYPFVLIDGSLDPEHPWGMSDVSTLKRLQDAVNRVGHIFVENTLLNGNTWVTIDQNALNETTLQRLSNIGAIIVEKQHGREVHRDPPPQMPAHMMEFVEVGLALMDQLAGISDTTISSQGRAEVRSDQQLEGLQQAAEVLIRSTSRRIEAGLERLGQRWISRIFQFYTQDRVLSYMGPTMEWKTYEFETDELVREIFEATKREAARKARDKNTPVIEDFDSMYARALRQASSDFIYRITPGSSLASTRAARAALSRNLAQEGLLSRTRALRDLGYTNPEEEIEKARQEALALGGLGGPEDSGQSKQTPIRRAM